jgi:hypothetical protein
MGVTFLTGPAPELRRFDVARRPPYGLVLSLTRIASMISAVATVGLLSRSDDTRSAPLGESEARCCCR